MPKISVIVCTYNRCQSLRQTLLSLIAQRLPNDLTLEIVVVDNNSSDNTRKVVEEISGKSSWPVRYYFEKNQGISFARNCGIREASGDAIAFTDDDIIPEPDWVANLWKSMIEHDAISAGGPVLPAWTCEPPKWIKDGNSSFYGMLALMDRGPEAIVINQPFSNFLIGGNFMLKKSTIEEFGFFRTDLGRTGKSLFGGEDSEMLRRILISGKKVVYAPNAVVRHLIPEYRMTFRYLRKWHFTMGRSTARLSTFRNNILWEIISNCLRSGAAALVFHVGQIKVKAAVAETNFWWKLGMLVELIQFPKRENVCQLSA